MYGCIWFRVSRGCILVHIYVDMGVVQKCPYVTPDEEPPHNNIPIYIYIYIYIFLFWGLSPEPIGSRRTLHSEKLKDTWETR